MHRVYITDDGGGVDTWQRDTAILMSLCPKHWGW